MRPSCYCCVHHVYIPVSGSSSLWHSAVGPVSITTLTRPVMCTSSRTMLRPGFAWTRLENLQRSWYPLAGFKGWAPSRDGGERGRKGGKGKGWEVWFPQQLSMGTACHVGKRRDCRWSRGVCVCVCVVCRYIQLLGIVPTDALIEKRLGEMFDADGDKTEAFTYFYNVCVLLYL